MYVPVYLASPSFHTNGLKLLYNHSEMKSPGW